MGHTYYVIARLYSTWYDRSNPEIIERPEPEGDRVLLTWIDTYAWVGWFVVPGWRAAGDRKFSPTVKPSETLLLGSSG